MSGKRKYFTDEEKGTSKLTSDGDLLIKSLLEKQLSKETNLSQELYRKKDFISSEYVPVNNFFSGVNLIGEIENTTKYCEELQQMKMAGLSGEDIDFYEDSKNGFDHLIMKHKNLNLDYISKRMKYICSKLEIYELKTHNVEDSVINKIGRHWTEFMLSIKPNSVETSLLKFAIKNEKTKCINVPSAMDNIKNIEEDWMDSKCYEKSPNISKIRKRARALKNHIETIKFEVGEAKNIIPHNDNLQQESFVENSNWDNKLPELKKLRNIVHQKQYCCEPQYSGHLYTIKDGNIIEFNSKLNVNYTKYQRLTLKEIKAIPKFAQYHPGIPSKRLFIKNLPSVSELGIDELFKSFNFETESIKILRGKMRGCAIVELRNSFVAEQSLNSMNGIILMNKPLIIEFGKKTS